MCMYMLVMGWSWVSPRVSLSTLPPHLCADPRLCYYKLTSDNDGEAFRWTSNYQIISKVYLKKHSSLPLCYSLSAADKKMVTSTP